jgi:transposase
LLEADSLADGFSSRFDSNTHTRKYDLRKAGRMALAIEYVSAANPLRTRSLGCSQMCSPRYWRFPQYASSPQRPKQEIHVICDNVSSHKTERVKYFLEQRRNLRLHYTPAYSSWLDHLENWFARIQRDVITRGTFTSVKGLDCKLMRYIREHSATRVAVPRVKRHPVGGKARFCLVMLRKVPRCRDPLSRRAQSHSRAARDQPCGARQPLLGSGHLQFSFAQRGRRCLGLP